jgi:molecular chaperone DnaK (HSP70)
MGAGGLSDDEIRDAIAEAEAAREADEQRKALVVAKNKVQSFNFSIARMSRENANLANEELIESTKPLLERADALLAKEDATVEDYDAMSAELSSCSCQWHELIYAKEKEEREKAEAEQAAQNQANGAPQDEPHAEP